MGHVLAKNLRLWGVGAMAAVGILSTASTKAYASPGCDAANNGTFTTSAPANMNTIRQFNTTFDIGDTLFATATGTPLGVGVDILPGLQTVLVVNGANGNGSTVVNNAGPHVLDITLAGGPGGAAFLNFSCTPVGPGGPAAAPGSTEQADTATNSTTTSVIVENGVVNGIIDDAAQEDPTPEDPKPAGPTQAEIDERNDITRELFNLEVDETELEAELKELRRRLVNSEKAQERGSIPGTNDGSSDGFAAAFTRMFVPVDVYNDLRKPDELAEDRAKSAEFSRIYEMRANIRKAEEELSSNRSRQAEIKERLKELPEETNDFTPDPEDLDDGDAILFAARDPFARALMRYRGFRLDVADTGEGFSDTVKPLSFTRTLSSTIVGWVRAVYTDYEQDDASRQEGDNILVALGIHKDFNDDLRIGLFATSTWGDVSSPVNNLDIDTTGYSLGAYGRYKWGEIDVNASTRIGLTDNDIVVGGTTGSYDTRLASFTFGVSGQEQLTDSVWMRPAISITNTWVNREDYVNSAGTAIGGNTTWTGNVSAGPTIGTSLTPPVGFKRLEPAIGLQATYNYSDQDTQAGTVTTSETDYLSLSVSPQLSMEFDNGASLDVFGSYFGIGADLDGWSVGGTLSIPLN